MFSLDVNLLSSMFSENRSEWRQLSDWAIVIPEDSDQ
jgi:hypothetical protein